MPCNECSEPGKNGDYEPCCDYEGICTAHFTTSTISMCTHCGAEMHLDESNVWRHYSQMELPLEERYLVHSMEKETNK